MECLESTFWNLTHWILCTVVHWPIAFAPGRGLFPSHPSIVGQIELDNDTTLVDTWKAMINLPKSKVRGNINHGHAVLKLLSFGVGPVRRCVEFHNRTPRGHY